MECCGGKMSVKITAELVLKSIMENEEKTSYLRVLTLN